MSETLETKFETELDAKHPTKWKCRGFAMQNIGNTGPQNTFGTSLTESGTDKYKAQMPRTSWKEYLAGVLFLEKAHRATALDLWAILRNKL